LSGAFGGLLAAGIVEGLEGVHGIRGWRWFIIEGAATAGFALVSIFFLLDFPATSRLLTNRERQIAIARLATENVTATFEDEGQRLSSVKATTEALKNWKTWTFVIGYMVQTTA
jgi:hypothetical protein